MSTEIEKAREWLDKNAEPCPCGEKHGDFRGVAMVRFNNAWAFKMRDGKILKTAELLAAYHASSTAEQPQSPILPAMLYRSLERLSLAIAECGKIGFEESSPTTNEVHAMVWQNLNEAQKDAKLKLKHYQHLIAAEYPTGESPVPNKCKLCNGLGWVNGNLPQTTSVCPWCKGTGETPAPLPHKPWCNFWAGRPFPQFVCTCERRHHERRQGERRCDAESAAIAARYEEGRHER